MYDILGTLIKEARPDEMALIAYLCEGRLLPAYAGVEIGMGEHLVASAVASAFSSTEQKVKLLFKTTGDLGDAAKRLAGRRPSNITVTQTYRSLLIDCPNLRTRQPSQENRDALGTVVLCLAPRRTLHCALRSGTLETRHRCHNADRVGGTHNARATER